MQIIIKIGDLEATRDIPESTLESHRAWLVSRGVPQEEAAEMEASVILGVAENALRDYLALAVAEFPSAEYQRKQREMRAAHGAALGDRGDEQGSLEGEAQRAVGRRAAIRARKLAELASLRTAAQSHAIGDPTPPKPLHDT